MATLYGVSREKLLALLDKEQVPVALNQLMDGLAQIEKKGGAEGESAGITIAELQLILDESFDIETLPEALLAVWREIAETGNEALGLSKEQHFRIMAAVRSGLDKVMNAAEVAITVPSQSAASA